LRTQLRGSAGATLTEVLISLLVMSVGVVSVISLFPLSILRALQANQLTSGKFAEQNATEIVMAYPTILQGAFPRPSDIDTGGTNPVVYLWEPSLPPTILKTYTPDVHFVVPPTASGSHSPASGKRFLCRDYSSGGGPLYSGRVEPDWSHPVQIGDIDGDGLDDYGVFDSYDGNADMLPDIFWQLDVGARVIDPHGSLFQEGVLLTEFGTDDLDSSTSTTGVLPRIDPFEGGATTVRLAQADALFALPDSWVLDMEFIPSAFTAPDSGGGNPGSITLPMGEELPFDPQTMGTSAMRVSLLNLNGAEVVSRMVNAPASNLTTLEFRWPNLPDSYDQDFDGDIDIDDIGTVRVEHFERRYTWLYTVSRADANEQPRVTCVVFFNRGISLDDEFLYMANFGNLATGDVDEDGNPDGDVDGDGTVEFTASNQVRIWYGTDPEPVIRAGNFIFDGRAGHWYQIQSIDRVEESTTPHTAVLSLSDPVYVSTPDTAALSAGTQGRAMLMRGIVHVFDLEL
jgi:hypothetical protein